MKRIVCAIAVWLMIFFQGCAGLGVNHDVDYRSNRGHTYTYGNN
jgi:hypothetical protein